MEYIYTFQMNSQFQIIIFKILWNGNTDHKATKNLEANTNTCNFVFTFFLQMDLMLGGQMYFHKISRET